MLTVARRCGQHLSHRPLCTRPKPIMLQRLQGVRFLTELNLSLPPVTTSRQASSRQTVTRAYRAGSSLLTSRIDVCMSPWLCWGLCEAACSAKSQLSRWGLGKTVSTHRVALWGVYNAAGPKLFRANGQRQRLPRCRGLAIKSLAAYSLAGDTFWQADAGLCALHVNLPLAEAFISCCLAYC